MDTGWTKVSSRFHVRRLASGKLLLLHHFGTLGRDHLCARLSMDDGRSWIGELILDGRDGVSYPDCTVDESGRIYCIYDHGRGSHLRSMRELVQEDREILCASFTEAEILAGRIQTPESYLRRVISALGVYTGTDPYPAEAQLPENLWIDTLCEKKSIEEIESAIYQRFGGGCIGITRTLAEELDQEMDALYRFAAQPEKKRQCIARITALLHNREEVCTPRHRLEEEIRQFIDSHLAEELSLTRIANAVSSSQYYICHTFKNCTGTTIMQYIAGRRVAHAKLLLEETDRSIADIAITTGYNLFRARFQGIYRCQPERIPHETSHPEQFDRGKDKNNGKQERRASASKISVRAGIGKARQSVREQKPSFSRHTGYRTHAARQDVCLLLRGDGQRRKRELCRCAYA